MNKVFVLYCIVLETCLKTDEQRNKLLWTSEHRKSRVLIEEQGNTAIYFLGTRERVTAGKATIFSCMANFCESELDTESLPWPHSALDGAVLIW